MNRSVWPVEDYTKLPLVSNHYLAKALSLQGGVVSRGVIGVRADLWIGKAFVASLLILLDSFNI